MTPEEIDAFLRQPHIADLATVRPDGSPHVAPVWFHYDNETVKVMAEPSAVKVRNIRHDARVSLSIATNREPYQYVLVTGRCQLSHEGIPELLQSMAIHYKGQEEGLRYAQQVLKETRFCILTITPSKMIGWSDVS